MSISRVIDCVRVLRDDARRVMFLHQAHDYQLLYERHAQSYLFVEAKLLKTNCWL